MGLKTRPEAPYQTTREWEALHRWHRAWQVRVELETQPLTLISASIARVIPLSWSHEARRIIRRKTTSHYFRRLVDVDTIFEKSIRTRLVWVVEGKSFSDTISNSTNRPERVITSWELLLFSRDITRQGGSSNSREYLLREGKIEKRSHYKKVELNLTRFGLRTSYGFIYLSLTYIHVNT